MPLSDYANTIITTGGTTGGLTGTSTTAFYDTSGYIQWVDGSGNGIVQSADIKKAQGLHPELYFKYIKKKFGLLEGMKMERRLKNLQKAFDKAVEAGQDMLAEKVMADVVREAKESAIYAKGFKLFIEKEDIDRFKHKIRNGHISDTQLAKYTRVIPQKVLDKKKKSEGLFDGYVVYHYYEEAVEEKLAKKQKMSSEEKSAMRDPVLFGWIKESNRLYFVGDWEDEYCDLTFDEIVDVIGKDEEELTIPRIPTLNADK